MALPDKCKLCRKRIGTGSRHHCKTCAAVVCSDCMYFTGDYKRAGYCMPCHKAYWAEVDAARVRDRASKDAAKEKARKEKMAAKAADRVARGLSPMTPSEEKAEAERAAKRAQPKPEHPKYEPVSLHYSIDISPSRPLSMLEWLAAIFKKLFGRSGSD